MRAGSIRPIAALTLAVLVFAALQSCAPRSQFPEGGELIPADVTFAVSVDPLAIVESDLYKRYQSDERAFGRNRINFFRFAQATGLDPSKDIRRVLFMARAGKQGLEEMSGVVIGTFDGKKVHEYLAGSGMPSKQVAGLDIFEFLVIEDRCRFCMTVLDGSTAAFGDGETLEKIARVKSGDHPMLGASEGAGRLLRRVARDAEAWGILRADDLKKGLTEVLSGLSANTSALAALGPIHEAAFSFDTSEPMRIRVEMTTTSDDDAMMVADVIKGAESLGRLALKEARPDLAKVMADFRVEADTGVVRLTASVPASDIEMVVKSLRLDRLKETLTSPGVLVAPSGRSAGTSP